jgi:hypothetical protein
MDNFDTLVSFVMKREDIRKRKEEGSEFLTHDPILSKYRFCNVRRRDDRVTKWLLDNYYVKNEGDVFFKALLARLVNWPPTLKFMLERGLVPSRIEQFDLIHFVNAMDELQKTGVKMYSSAYIVYPTRVKGNTKAKNLGEYIIKPINEIARDVRLAIVANSVEHTTTTLSQSFGISTFIAGQVAADLTYLDGQLNHAIDLYSWSPIGPGSQRGLNRLYNRNLSKKIEQSQFNKELVDVRNKVITANKEFEDLTLHDVQNVMCEFDKYLRVYLKEGAPRQLYKPERAY